VQAAYIFGSQARGRARHDSDVDVAVLVDQTGRRRDPLRLRLQLMAEVGAALGRSDVDLILLNDAPPLLAHRVLSEGRLVFQRSAAARVRFQVKTAREYSDLIPVLDARLTHLKARLRMSDTVG
jgi:predicted nucleotidyltransferase